MIRKAYKFLASNSLIKDSFIYIIGAIFLKGVTFLLIPIYTKTFTPEQFGIVELINTIINIGVILCSFGLVQYFYMTFLQKSNYAQEKLISDIIKIFFKISLPLCCFIGIICFFLVSDVAYGFFYKISLAVLASFIIYLSLNQSVIYNTLQLQRRSLTLTINKLLTGVLMLVLNWYFITYTSIGIVGIFLSNLIAFSLSLYLMKSAIPGKTLWSSRKLVANLQLFNFYYRKSYIFIITSLSYFALSGADKLIVKFLLGNTALGLYSVAFKFSSVYEPLLIAPILSAYTPHAFSMYKEKEGLPKEVYFFAITFFTVTIASIVTPYIAKHFIDVRYIDSVKLIPFLIGGFGFVFLAQAAAVPILFHQKTKTLLINVLSAGCINIFLNFFLGSLYGLNGISIAFFLSNFSWYLITLVQAARFK